MQSPDDEAIARVHQGETAAFGQVFHRHYPGIRRYLRHTLQPGDDADDLAVEVFVRAFRGAARFRPQSDGSFIAYLYTVARNLVIDTNRRRSARVRGRTEAPLAEATFADDEGELSVIEDDLLTDEAASRVRAALQLLPEEDRQIVVLSYQHDLSARDIMAVLGKPSEAAVRAHLCRALKRLRSIASQDQYFADEQTAMRGGESDGR